ncbi:hypothetical protein ACEUZ9_004692 [Paracoccus litorisediminis]|uniref:hypothetical protein n=1 Tax=Paracoccus litorisediminis TaxID=2006130 RepID=UPI00372DCE2A
MGTARHIAKKNKTIADLKVATSLRSRSRGVTLMEAILALGVAASMIGVTAHVIGQEQQRQKAMLLGAEGELALKASRDFVAQNYAALQDELFTSAGPAGLARKTFTTSEMISRGYLPPSFQNSGILGKLYGQQYALVMRAVNRTDTTTPQATMTRATMDPSNTGAVDPGLRDRNAANGEIDIEAVLVTYGGTALKPAVGGEVINRLNSSYAGFVNTTGTASGAYGSFSVSMAPYASMTGYPTTGHFASVVALSNFGVLGAESGEGEGIPDPFRRCTDMGLSSAAYAACLSSNEVYTDIVLNSFDTNGDGTDDRFPAIRGLSMVQCANDNDENTDPSRFVIDCAETRMSGNLVVEGTDATIGNLDITADEVSFHGKKTISNGPNGNEVSADKLTIDGYGSGGQDVAKAIFHSQIAAPGTVIMKPQCPAGMTPDIYVTPVAYADRYGRPIVGIRAGHDLAQETPTRWRIRMVAYIGQDFCGQSLPNGGGVGGRNSINGSVVNAIPVGYTLAPNAIGNAPVSTQVGTNGQRVYCSTFTRSNVTTYNPATNANEIVMGPDTNGDGSPDPVTRTEVAQFHGDGKADLYELDSSLGRAIVQTRCY